LFFFIRKKPKKESFLYENLDNLVLGRKNIRKIWPKTILLIRSSSPKRNY